MSIAPAAAACRRSCRRSWGGTTSKNFASACCGYATYATGTLTRGDALGAVAVFLLVFLSTFPIVIPFVVFDRVQLALRVSNLIAIVMLFCLGYWLGQHGGYRPLRTGSTMVLLGLALVGIAIALGG